MRLLICSKRDLTSLITLNELLPALGRHEVRILLANRTRGTEHRIRELTEMKFFDRDLPFEHLLPAIDAAGGAGARWATFAGLERRYGVSVAATSSLRDQGTAACIADFRPDLILSMRFSFIFGAAIRRLPRLGILNVHPGRLPRYAGLYPHMRALAAGERRLWATLHQIDDGIDTGPIVAEDSIAVDPTRSAYCHQLDLHLLGNRLFLAALDRLESGQTLPARPQDPAQRVYASYPTSEDFQRFRDMGWCLLDVTAYGALLRGFEPTSRTARSDRPIMLAAAAG